PPRAPTDPYVRDYRIRLLGLGTRCETIDRLHHTGGWKRIPLKHRAKPIPSHPCAVRAPVQPLPPNAPDLISVPLQGRKVSGEAVVGVVALQLALELAMLRRNRQVTVGPAPSPDGPERPGHSVLGRMALHDRVPSPGVAPVVREAQEIEGARSCSHAATGRSRLLKGDEAGFLRMER